LIELEIALAILIARENTGSCSGYNDKVEKCETMKTGYATFFDVDISAALFVIIFLKENVNSLFHAPDDIYRFEICAIVSPVKNYFSGEVVAYKLFISVM